LSSAAAEVVSGRSTASTAGRSKTSKADQASVTDQSSRGDNHSKVSSKRDREQGEFKLKVKRATAPTSTAVSSLTFF